MASSLVDIARAQRGLIHDLTADAFAQVSTTGSGSQWDLDLARLVLRSKVWSARRKAEHMCSYSAEDSSAVLRSFELPADLAARCGLPQREGFTWFDAVVELQKQAKDEAPHQLWERVENHPMVQYTPMQCQSCGRQVPDTYPDPEDPDLMEDQPTEQERPFVRSGWFRGPRGPVVFVYRCPECGSTSRWFRSSHPEVALNPRRWGRLCGEQEDLKIWLARYLGVRLRVCCPLDWDHVWTEVWDGSAWLPLDPNCVNFARRLHEGIGSWTRVLAIGTPVSGGASCAGSTEDATEAYLARAGGTPEELQAWRSQIAGARADVTGGATQGRTLCGHILERAGFDDDRVTRELQRAQRSFDANHEWWDLESADEAGESHPEL